MKRNQVDMLSGPIFKGLLSMTIPIMIMNVMQNMFNLIDMTILGNLATDTAVGAVGTCSALITLCTGLLIGISTGSNVVVAKTIGSGDKERTEKAIGTAVLFSVVSGLVVMIIGVIGAETFLRWIKCPETLLAPATLYLRLYFLGVPFLMLYNFSASILRAGGETKRPMYYLLLGGTVKVILSYFLISIFDMSVDGVAVTTIISNILSGTLCFVTLKHGTNTVKFNFNKCRFYAREMKEILTVGIPAGLQIAVYSFANTVIVTAVNGYGPDAATGVSVANQFDGILYQISVASALAATPYIAQNVGADNLKRAKKAIVNSIWITMLFGGGLGLLSAIFCRELSSLVSTTPEVIKFSCQKMVLISSTYFICGINEVMAGTLRGVGKPVVPTIASLLFMCLIRFPWVYFVFPHFSSLTYLYLIWPIGWILSIITQLIAYFSAMSKLQKNQCMETNCIEIE